MRILSKDKKSLIFVEDAVKIDIKSYYGETKVYLEMHYGGNILVIDYFDTEKDAMDMIYEMFMSDTVHIIDLSKRHSVAPF